MNNRVIRRRQFGQGMTEYIIIVALVAIAAIAVYSFFGNTVRSQMGSITSQLAGGDGKTEMTDAGTAADKAKTEAGARYALDNYNTSATNAGQKGH